MKRLSVRGWLVTVCLLLAVASTLLLLDGLRGGWVWREAYPHLPRRAQALPYRLRASIPAADRTPVPLPTPGPADARPANLGPQGISSALPVTPSSDGRERPTSAPGLPPAEPGAELLAAPSLGRLVPSPSPSPALPASVELTGLKHVYQTWNNCGPATIGMALGLLGDDVDQASAARQLKPDPDDKNVSPRELAAFARERGFRVRLRVAGDRRQLQALLALGLPVVVETWFIPDPGDEMGHYLLLTGYQGLDEDPAGHFLAADSYHGPRVELPYDDFDGLWRVFNRLYLVLYPPEREAEVRALLGPADADEAMWQAALAQAMAEQSEAPDDAIAVFNMGSSLLALGDVEGAAAAYDRARTIGLPWRMLWYQDGPFVAYAATGRWGDLAALAQANLANAGKHEESQYWLGRALEGLGEPTGAKLAYQGALRDHPGFAPALQALEALADPVP